MFMILNNNVISIKTQRCVDGLKYFKTLALVFLRDKTVHLDIVLIMY